MLVKKRKRHISDSNDFEVEEVPKKKTQQFSGISFCNAIKGEHAIEAVKEFVSLCKSEDAQNVVLQYLKAGGGASELLGLIKPEQKKNMTVVVPVFSALQYVIITATDSQTYKVSTIEACKHLLTHHLSTVHEMLSVKSNTKHKRIILKLLSAMVTVTPRLAHMVLKQVKIDASSLINHSKPVETSVRTAFIHFLMAFLIYESPLVIRALLEKKGLLASIIPGLMFDSAETVHLVLSTLKSKILMNQDISKSNKLQIFNTSILMSLMKLYSWKGPSKWKSTFKEHEEETKKIEEEKGGESKENRQIVLDVVQEFLHILCTSHKYGVIFHDRSIGTSGTRNNHLLESVLDHMEKPWEHKEIADLVHKIVLSCPDLMKCILHKIQPFLEPRVSFKWVETIRFLKQLIQNMNPEQCLKPYVNELSSQQITNVVQTLSIPPVVLKALSSGMLQYKNLVIRHEAASLLVTMLQRFQLFMTLIKQWHPINPVHEHAFRQIIIKQLPTSEAMLSLWTDMMSPPEEIRSQYASDPSSLMAEPSRISCCTVVMDLLLSFNTCFPHVLDIPSSIDFMADLENMMENDDDMEAVAIIQENILKLLISVDNYIFIPDKEAFGVAIRRLSNLVDGPSAKITLQARNILATLLINTGLFEGVLSEVLVWLHCFLAVPEEERKSVVKLLVDSIQKVSNNPAEYVNYVLQAEDRGMIENKEVVDTSQFEDVFDELLENAGDEYNEENKQEQEPTALTAAFTLGPLLPGVLETAAANIEHLDDVKHFLSYVIIHLLHTQTSQSIINHLLDQWPGLVPASITAYVSGWSTENSPQALKKPFGSRSLESKISKTLLQSESDFVHDILGLENESSEISNLKTKDPVHLLLLYKLSLFHMVQLASRGELTEELRNKCKDALVSLLKVLEITEINRKEQDETYATLSKELLQLLGEENFTLYCLKYTFRHPFLLQKFMPICRESCVTDRLITELILDLVDLVEIQPLNFILKPFKQKLIHGILRSLKKCQKNKSSWLNVEGIVSIVELFELDFSDVMKLLVPVVSVPSEALICTTSDKPSISVWGSLLVHLLDCCISLHSSVKDELIFSIVKQVSQLTEEKNVDISPLEDSLFKYLQLFPHHIRDLHSKKLIHSLMHQEVTNAACIRLLDLLLTRKPGLIKSFALVVQKSKKLRKNAYLIFPFLATVLKMNIPIDQAILDKTYEGHRNEIKRSILEPLEMPEWLRENISVVVYLVDKCTDTETCSELCMDIKIKNMALVKCDESYVELLKCVFLKASKKEEFLLICFDLLISSLKETELNQKLIAYLCETLQKLVTSNGEICINHTEVKNAASWTSFVKMCLKFGLKSTQEVDKMLLDTLKQLCVALFVNGSGADDNKKLSQIFHMTLSHSEFLNIMLGSSKKKDLLLGLLLTLAGKNPSVMSSKHIPVFLSSYGATMDTTDRLILQLLQLYETNGISLHQYRPYLWGEAASNHYSVRSSMAVSLWRQPTTSHVLDLLNKEFVTNTVNKFPLDRRLHGSEITSLPSDDTIYDPAFYLPLFSHLLAPESVVQFTKFISSGGFALTVIALSSTCDDTRAAAYHVLSRLYFHGEAIRQENTRILSLQFLDAIRNGVAALRNASGNPKLSCIITTFLARTSLITPSSEELYSSLQKFIIAKPALNMNVVPEFSTFMYSPDIKYKLYRKWILQVICDGLRSKEDFDLSEKAINLLLGFYSSVLCDDSTKVLILRILESAVKLKTPAVTLVSSYGLISWLHQTIQQLPEDNIQLMRCALDIIHSLWTTLSTSKNSEDIRAIKKLIKSPDLQQRVLLLALEFLQKTSLKKWSVSDLNKFLQVIYGVASFDNAEYIRKELCSLISLQTMNKILNLSKDVLGSISDCEDLILYGCNFASSTSECHMETNDKQAVFHLRSLVVMWLKKMYKGNAAK